MNVWLPFRFFLPLAEAFQKGICPNLQFDWGFFFDGQIRVATTLRAANQWLLDGV
jgi:hypothetical protein